MSKVIEISWARYAIKAAYAGAVAFLGSLIAAVQAGSLNLVTWLTVALTTVIAIGGVFGLNNGPNPRQARQSGAQVDLVPSAYTLARGPGG